MVPALNEEESVGQVVEELRREAPGFDVVVVDDGSTDATADRARAAGAAVLSHPFNLGIGGAVQSGYRYAFVKGYDVAVQVDGDGQHDPSQIAKLEQGLSTSGADLVWGSRFLEDAGYRVPRLRRAGRVIFARIVSLHHPQGDHRPDLGLPHRQPPRDRAVRSRLPPRLPRGRGDPDGSLA